MAGSSFGKADVNHFMSDVNCTGEETSIAACTYLESATHDLFCDETHQAGVRCIGMLS